LHIVFIILFSIQALTNWYTQFKLFTLLVTSTTKWVDHNFKYSKLMRWCWVCYRDVYFVNVVFLMEFTHFNSFKHTNYIMLLSLLNYTIVLLSQNTYECMYMMYRYLLTSTFILSCPILLVISMYIYHAHKIFTV
jgi:hypothetical protein